MASPLEQFVNTIRTQTSNGTLRELIEYLAKSTELLQKNGQHLDNVLETLDLQHHTLGVLHILCAKFAQNTNCGQENRFLQVQEFITTCNGEQIRLVPDVFAELCHFVTRYLIEMKQAIRGINLMHKAIMKLRLYDSQLTSIHADLCQLCLHAKCFKPALEILDVDITGICQEITAANGPQFDAKYFLLYFYYGGMIYLALKDLDRALYFFEVAITTPARAISHIMLEAYKKYVIVSVLLYGKEQPLPKYASNVVERFIKHLSQPYNSLATAFELNNTNELNNILNKNRDVFIRDHNLGLVKQVSSVLYKKNIQRLTKTFLTLSLSDVASRVGLQSPSHAEQYILHMIEEKQIYATINQKDGMVIFLDEPDKHCGPEVLKELEKELALCMELDKQILTMDCDIQVNPQYVRKSTSTQDDEQPCKSTYAI